MKILKIAGYILLVIVLVVLVVQYINAARYEALVQVIDEDRIGVNPTPERLDFGDLPRDKSAIRNVTLESKGNTSAYVIVWNRGEIGNFMKVNRNFFTLEAGKSVKLEYSVQIPNSAEYRYYRGKSVIFQIPKFW